MFATNSTKEKLYCDLEKELTYHVLFKAKNSGINPITFEKVKYDFYKEGKKVASGCIGKPSGCRSPNSLTVPGLSSDNYQLDFTVGNNQSGVPPFVLNGTYYYANSNTTIIGEPFRFIIH